jgi:hypothetical protein
MARKKTQEKLLPFKEVLFGQRFLETYVGSKILHDEVTALVELIANSWDAGATEVRIAWPEGPGTRTFSIEDNGIGMTGPEFRRRWMMLAYDRITEQGATVVFPEGASTAGIVSRRVFGRNGIGRFAGFCFASEYCVETKKDGQVNHYRVCHGDTQPFQITQLNSNSEDGHGTTLYCTISRPLKFGPDEIRSEIGMRFLTDPHFKVSLNGKGIDFSHIEGDNIVREKLRLTGHDVTLIVIDTRRTDRTTKQHGVAWHVDGRLVSDCSWQGLGRDALIDGRRIAAKRFQFIIKVGSSLLAAVKKDWSGFDPENKDFLKVSDAVYASILKCLLAASEEDRKKVRDKALYQNKDRIEGMSPVEFERWNEFVEAAQEACPSIREKDILTLSEVVANLEQAKSNYALVHKLGELEPGQLDELYQILDDWTLDMAKQVLDEIGKRLKLVEQSRKKISDPKTREVQELQPLFKDGLWIFGPEFETIEYTSNEGMTKVIQTVFGRKDLKGSKNRPDFVILPDGTAGLYSYPRYDGQGGEIGVDHLVLIELKAPNIPISTDQKDQCWKYVQELRRKGLVTDTTKVRCFVLGERLDPLELQERTQGSVTIQSLDFFTVLCRAESRLLRLKDRVKNAPFLKDHRDKLAEFLAPVEPSDVLSARSNPGRSTARQTVSQK